jgi:parallel beta-helix repeat protein
MVNNSITNNLNGISGELCSENTVVGNSIRDNYLGIWMGHYSMRNILTFNDIRNHWAEGISMWESHQNIIAGNNILANNHGGHWTAIVLGDSSYNSIFHNNIVNKGKQIDVNRTNIWDEEYPSGGNYWSDYSGSDLYSGPYQNKTGSDGIGDTPYVIDADNEDKYPLIDPYPLPDMQRIYNEFYKLLADFIELQSEYDELQSSYRDLAGRYNSLEAQLNRLQSEYTGLQSKYDSLRNELNITRSIMYALLITTIVFIAITVYIVIRKPKVKPELEIA